MLIEKSQRVLIDLSVEKDGPPDITAPKEGVYFVMVYDM